METRTDAELVVACRAGDQDAWNQLVDRLLPVRLRDRHPGLQALEREDFLSAVTGSESSRAVAESVIARRLGGLRADLTTEGGAA